MYIFELFTNGARGDGDFEEMADGLRGDESCGGIGEGVENLRTQGIARKHPPAPKVSMHSEETLPIPDIPRLMMPDIGSEDCRSRGIIRYFARKDQV